MSRHNLCFIVRQCETCIGSANHAIDCSTRSRVDKGIETVKENVAGMNHISIHKVDVNIGVRVCLRHVSKVDLVVIYKNLLGVRECLLWQGTGRGCGQIQVEKLDLLRR